MSLLSSLKEKNPKLLLLTLSLLSGLLLWLAWPMSPLFPLVFIGFVPLLYAENLISTAYTKSGRKVFLFSYIGLLVWNILTTWWVCNASMVGGVFAIAANALLMTTPFVAFHHTKKIIGMKLGLVSFVCYWIGFEYIHLNWELTWPWLTLGNVFAHFPNVVQWYEYTGHLGGSLWVLLMNVSIFTAIMGFSKWKGRAIMRPLFFLIFPLVVSFSLIPTDSLFTNPPQGTEVIVIQPNINSYTEKFTYNARTGERNTETFMPHKQQLQILLDESEKLITPDTRYLFWPETSIPGGYWEESLDSDPMLLKVRDVVRSHKNLTLISGTDTYKSYGSKEEASVSARYRNDLGYFDVYNTGMQINEKGHIQVYHKSKLVPGVERMPYPGLLGFLEILSIDMGGISGSLGTQKERTVFKNEKEMAVAPVICYESVFGAYVGEYIVKGAQLITIITNDNWWDDTPGYKQHFEYARLRAIEHRRDIARAANTGISGFIYADGSVGETLGWNQRGGVKAKVILRNDQTYYTTHGDYLGRIFGFIGLAFLLSAIVKRLTTKST